jgi:hypothetical protein
VGWHSARIGIDSENITEGKGEKLHNNYNTVLREKPQQLVDYIHPLTCPSIAFSGVAKTPKGG